MGEFFTVVGEIFSRLWDFGDGFYGVGITAVSIAIVVLCCVGAVRLRDNHEWLSAVVGVTGGVVGVWWLLGILPSAWFYFVSGEQDYLEDRAIPASLPGLDDFYNVFRDTIVVAITAVGAVALVIAILWVQRRYPRGLAEGEEKGAASGGYK